jgi:hypothetical protein
MGKKKVLVKQGDFVEFHTQYGKTTGIVQYIKLGSRERKHFQTAVIIVHLTAHKTKTYERPLFKLKVVK